MKKILFATTVMMVTLLLCIPASGAEGPSVRIKALNIPKNKPLQLAVGEVYTFDILIESDQPFVIAVAMLDEYYPGRSVFSQGDRATNSTSALLQVTVTGKQSTAGLYAVCDWPEPGDCWPEGVAPVAIVAGVRFAGGGVVAEQFPFAIVIP
jgi:hypothetical protein